MSEPGLGEQFLKERPTNTKPTIIRVTHEGEKAIAPELKLEEGNSYLLGRKPASTKQVKDIQARNQVRSLLFLEPASGNGQEIGQLSREHLIFHLAGKPGGLSDAFFVLDSVPGRNQDIVVYYKGAKLEKNGDVTPPETPKLATPKTAYEVTNLVVLLPGSDREAVKIEFTGSGSGYEPGKGASVSAIAKLSLSATAHAFYERA